MSIKLSPGWEEIYDIYPRYGTITNKERNSIIKALPKDFKGDIKKSGKTAMGGLVCQYWAEEMEPYNEIYRLANDREQAESRVWARIEQSIKLSPGWEEIYDIYPRYGTITNKERNSIIKALLKDFKGEAGANPGLSSWDELWAYGNRGQKLWDEFTPVPTRSYSVRFVGTYAGFRGESTLLWGIYDDVVKPEYRLPGTDLPIYLKGSRLVFWGHTPRLPWQTPQYYEKQKDEFAGRPLAYARLHRNEWVQKETAFVPLGLWDDCENPDLERWKPGDDTVLYVGVDASRSKDCTALVAVAWNAEENKVQLKHHRIWRPEASELLGGKRIVDLEETVEAELKWMKDQGAKIIVVPYDPYAMGTISLHLAKAGFELFEFVQIDLRVKADGLLYDLITQGYFEYYPGCDDLKRHIQNAVKVETAKGIRIKKEKARKPVDAVVALAMAAFMAAAPEYAEEDIEIEAAVF